MVVDPDLSPDETCLDVFGTEDGRIVLIIRHPDGSTELEAAVVKSPVSSLAFFSIKRNT
jgi:hypothetical protein